jgi:hypothetical protein
MQHVAFLRGLRAGYLLFSADFATLARMSLRCLFNVHRPMLTSIVTRANGFAALWPLARTKLLESNCC